MQGSTVNMNILAPIYEGTASTIPEPHDRLAFTLWIGMSLNIVIDVVTGVQYVDTMIIPSLMYFRILSGLVVKCMYLFIKCTLISCT